jgi:rhodanese-related sulfurtransferase
MSLIEFINNNTLLVGGTLGVFLLAIFNELKIKESNICGLTPLEAVKLINNNALIYDLRDSKDFEKKHILNAVNIDQNNVEGGLPKNKGPVLFVCEGGALSKKTSLSLRSKKLDNVFYIKGGQLEWENSLLPCETKPKE